ncbi:hypothetical protein ALC62_13421 [Cyphomyrmex costatus]|uniref:Uncharacterized protein n=1 Tax=Cyphomyrmex costatus TaxID=456900 RepID=A0A195C733_9HYME|nr:hypothetical protein ALC62_13421 [Cyphomyrmex costatus]
MNNASLGSAEHGGCAQTSEPQLELEESTVHSIERNAASRRARARQGEGCSGCGLRATSEFRSTDVRQFDPN